jgi:heme exporter protein D
MDINTFYAVTSATCFTLVGLWWSVVKSKTEWLKDEATRRLAGGVYASFLIPALMSLGAQIGGENRFVWQAIFTIAALLGIVYTTRLMRKTHNAVPQGTVSRNRWIIPVLYAFVLLFAIFPGIAIMLGLQPLQLEGVLLCVLILVAHLTTWEFMVTQAQK